ncbi:hypothetical protein LI90_3928 [Carbonactinospora thermoautotrophica]|uniref:Integral membrane protein n=2 Tax=Carbonactinospora thermoautotrophica TaxID=1469144 RepID=A0A132MYA3_9ACTN|nr:hypothetical protein [Carbonactinospora thermoautotrophica]KWX02881.1 hypothetical protein LI90_3928 [Carbonactinospora thermoautotrophica]
MVRRALAVLLAGGVLVAGAPAAAVVDALPELGEPQEAFSFQDPDIAESSGLAVSRRHPGVVYTFDDSGHGNRIYAVGPDGRTRAVLRIAGAVNRDWEAIAPGRDEQGRPALFIGDIGDNLGGAWRTISVYRVTEPAELRSGTLRATRYRFRYADGARDAEALLVEPRTNRLYVVSKEKGGGGVYAAPSRLSTERVNVLRRVGDAPSRITDGAFAPDGSRFVVRGYFDATEYAMEGERPGRQLRNFGLPLQRQGEGIAYTPDGRALLLSSEGVHSAVWRIPLVDPRTGDEPAGDVAQQWDGSGLLADLLALAGVAALGALLWRAFRGLFRASERDRERR